MLKKQGEYRLNSSGSLYRPMAGWYKLRIL